MKPCSHTTLEDPLQKHTVGQGLGVEEGKYPGLCPSQLHWLLHPKRNLFLVCELLLTSSHRKPVTLVPYSSVINGYMLLLPVQTKFTREKNF